jgi:excisionase family DNA binding protein
MTTPALYRVKDAAAYLSLHEREVRRLVKAGILHRRYTSQRSYRITAESIEAYITSLPSESVSV